MNTIFKSGLILIFAFAMTSQVYAASVYPSTSSLTVSTGGTFIVDVMMNTEGQTLNAIEGELDIVSSTQNYSLADIILGGSEMNLWTEKPQIIKSGPTTTIKFTGGSTSGFNKNNALLMKLAVNAQGAGSIEFKPKPIKAFLHDGTGTSVQTTVKNISVRVVQAEGEGQSQDSLKDLFAQDNTPPPNFEISLGQDLNSFDGKHFISFVAEDAESGIAYYEVKEGNYSAVRTGSPYILIDQDLKSTVVVAAYDKAGNSRVMTWEPQSKSFGNKLLGRILVIVAVILMALGIWFVVSMVKKIWLKRKQKV